MISCNANTTVFTPYTQVNNSYVEISTPPYGDYYRYNAKTLNSFQCTSDQQCFDGNVCTMDKCSQGNCLYQPAGNCQSIDQNIREQITPYNYYGIVLPDSWDSQNEFMQQMIAIGNEVTYDLTSLSNTAINLPFSLLFYGNLIKQASISWNRGLVMIPPYSSCSIKSIKCSFFTSSTNLISPWYKSVWKSVTGWSYVQVIPDTKNKGSEDQDHESKERSLDSSSSSSVLIRGVAANALHVLFNATTVDSNDIEQISTFSSSLYQDGSIRLSYLSSTTPAVQSDVSYYGLWGAFASLSPSYQRYHQENISVSLVNSGNDIVYCPFNTTACIPETCVSSGKIMKINWNGTESCTALSPEFNLSLSCQWFGGLATTPAWISIPTSSKYVTGELSCRVPYMNVTDGSIVPVAIVTSIVPSGSSSYQGSASFLPSELGQKVVYGVMSGANAELSRYNLMTRYYRFANATPSSCGCSPLPQYQGSSCSAQGVCGQAQVRDCAGSPFGSAYNDACSDCAGGYTGVTPSFDCDLGGSSELFSLLTQTIILLMIICCMTFITSSISYSIRRMLNARNNQDDFFLDAEFGVQMFETGTASARRGLTEFELGAIGEITFTKEFYRKHLLEKQRRENEEAAVAAKGGSTGGGEEGKDKREIIDFSSAADGDDSSNNNKDQEKSADSCECSICLMDIEEGSACRVLPEPCGHIFHVSCIDQWFQQSAVCPLCKRSMRAILEGGHDSEVVFQNSGNNQTATGYSRRVAGDNPYAHHRMMTHSTTGVDPMMLPFFDDDDDPLAISLTLIRASSAGNNNRSARGFATSSSTQSSVNQNHNYSSPTAHHNDDHDWMNNHPTDIEAPSLGRSNRSFMSLLAMGTGNRIGMVPVPTEDTNSPNQQQVRSGTPPNGSNAQDIRPSPSRGGSAQRIVISDGSLSDSSADL
jgi:hypothetical protein